MDVVSSSPALVEVTPPMAGQGTVGGISRHSREAKEGSYLPTVIVCKGGALVRLWPRVPQSLLLVMAHCSQTWAGIFGLSGWSDLLSYI